MRPLDPGLQVRNSLRPAEVPSRPAASTSAVRQPLHFQQPPGDCRIGYDGCITSEPSYLFRNLDEDTFHLIASEAKSRARSQPWTQDWPGVTFDTKTRSLEVRLDPIAAGRFLGSIGVYKIRPQGEQASMLEKYDKTIKSLTESWVQATSSLVAAEVPNPSAQSGPNDPRRFREMVRAMLAHGSCCFAEASHLDNRGLMSCLKNNMEEFKKHGVDTIYTEYLCTEVCQKFSRPDGSLDFEKASKSRMFQDEIGKWPYGRDAMEVLRAADKHGVRVVGINSHACYPLDMDRDDDEAEDEDLTSAVERMASMNRIALETYHNDLGRQGKCIFWGGAGHFKSCRSGQDAPGDVRGINVPLGLPCIVFSESKTGEWGVFHRETDRGDAPACVCAEGDSFFSHGWGLGQWDAWVACPQDDPMSLQD